MDAYPAIESIVHLMTSLPDESVESLLVTLDALVGVSDEGLRPSTAQLLRNTAESCPDTARCARLLRAAGAVAAGEPCALTPDGLTWKQAASSQTATQAEWDERIAQTPLPPLPGESADPEDEEPPKLLHLRVRHFFPGLVVRVGRDFADAYGRAVCTGDLLKVFSMDSSDDGFEVASLERTVRFSANVAGHDAILENADNAWFQPVSTAACLENVIEAVDHSLSIVDEDDSDEDAVIEGIAALREDVDECRRWLSQSGERGPAPQCRSGRLAPKSSAAIAL
jgi:hypothetical protein